MNQKNLRILVLLFSFASFSFLNSDLCQGADIGRELILTFSQAHTSLDPLDADASNNIRVARMLFATPVHTSLEDKLESFVLESFSYSAQTKKVEFKIKKNIKYSDGSNIEARDIALAIARMLLARPEFPVIKNISGKAEWLKRPYPLESLPKGLEVLDDTVVITYDEAVNHPLFRFTLEIFGIIPARCIDLKRSKVVCDELPLSGPYRISEKLADSTLFELRDDFQRHYKGWLPKRIRFTYKSLENVLAEPSQKNDIEKVVMGLSDSSKKDVLKELEQKMSVRYLQKSAMRYLLINESGIFKRKVCRQIFADRYRSTFGKMVDKPELVSSSYWPQLIGGFEEDSVLKSRRKYSAKDVEDCTSAIRSNGVKWGTMEQNKDSFASKSIKETLISFGAKTDPIVYTDLSKRAADFAGGNLDIGLYFSGLWPLDPYGDAEMMFSPGLHDNHKRFQKDKYLQSRLNLLASGKSEKERKTAVEINEYLYDEAYFNIYNHMSFYYASKNADVLKHLPSAVTGAYPWQVFHD